jgi:hypothetical protein
MFKKVQRKEISDDFSKVIAFKEKRLVEGRRKFYTMEFFSI